MSGELKVSPCPVAFVSHKTINTWTNNPHRSTTNYTGKNVAACCLIFSDFHYDKKISGLIEKVTA